MKFTKYVTSAFPQRNITQMSSNRHKNKPNYCNVNKKHQCNVKKLTQAKVMSSKHTNKSLVIKHTWVNTMIHRHDIWCSRNKLSKKNMKKNEVAKLHRCNADVISTITLWGWMSSYSQVCYPFDAHYRLHIAKHWKNKCTERSIYQCRYINVVYILQNIKTIYIYIYM